MSFDRIFLPKNKVYSIIFFVIIGIVTVVLSLGFFNLDILNDVTVLLPENAETNAEREKIARLNKEFPSDQMLFITVSDNPFREGKIEKLWQLCHELDNLYVVKSTLHPFNATSFKKIGETFQIVRNNPNDYPKTAEEIEKFKNTLKSNRYLIGSVISYDYNTAGIVVRINFDAMVGKEIENPNFFVKFLEKIFDRKFGIAPINRTDFSNEVEKVLKKYDNDFPVLFAGVPAYEAKTKNYMLRDMTILIGPAIILMIIILYLSFGTKRGVILPMIAMLMSLVWTMGLLGWLRIKMNIVSILIPPIILTIGSSYTLHYMNSYYNLSGTIRDKRDLINSAAKHIFPTIFMAALTTIVGFASFFTVSIGVIKEFGIIVIVSIFFTLFLTFFLLPKILFFTYIPKENKIEHLKSDVFAKMLAKLNSFVYPLRYFWISLLFVIMVVAFFVIPNIKVETDVSAFFKDGDKIKQGIIFLQRNFKGSTSFNIAVRSKDNKRNFFKTREGLLAAKKVQDYIDRNVVIDGYTMLGWNLSPVTLAEDLNETMYGTLDIPESDRILNTFFTFLLASKDDGVKGIMNNDFTAINFQVRTVSDNKKMNYMISEQELLELTRIMYNDLSKIAAEDGRFTVEVWGELLLLASISRYLVSDQIINIISSVILVVLVVLILFRSLFYSLIAIIPLIYGVLMNFSIMSIFGISLDPGTVMIGAIAVGTGIDGSLHFLLNYRRILKTGIPVREAVDQTLAFASRPMVFTAVSLICGFMVFVLSSFKPILFFGLLISISMFNCVFAALFILPSAILVSDKVSSIFKKK